VFYWSGFLAFAARIAAWGKKRLQAAREHSAASGVPLPFTALGGAMIAFVFLSPRPVCIGRNL
jgi:hypothetical protein